MNSHSVPFLAGLVLLGGLWLTPLAGAEEVSPPPASPEMAAPVASDESAGSVEAAEPAEAAQPEELSAPAQPRLPFPGMRFFDATHGFFSRNLEKTSDHVDAFFGDDRIFAETSTTYARLSGSVIYGKEGELTFDGTVRMRVDLSNLNRRFHLLVASDDVSNEEEKITTGDRFFDRIDTADPVAALQIILQEKRRWDVRLQPGIKLRVPVDPFIKLRMRRLQPLSENWLARATLVPAWYDSRGWEMRGTLDFDTAPSERSLLRFTTGLRWQEGYKKNVLLRESVFYSYQLNRITAVAAETGVEFDTVPHLRDSTYFALIRLRRDLHEGWIFGEIKPQILFERAYGFRPDPSLVLTVEMFFGEQYL